MADEKELDLAIEEAGILQEMTSCKGWAIFKERMMVVYNDAVKSLIVSKDKDADITTKERIKAIDEFMSWPEKMIKQAQEAKKENDQQAPDE